MSLDEFVTTRDGSADMSTVSPQWLAVRAPADDAARSPELAEGLARLMRPGVVTVHDLGAGTGAMARWLAPRLPGPQRWVLHDADAGILEFADLRSVVDDAGRPVTTSTRVEALADLPPDAFTGASAVAASALLDVITAAEAERIVDACVAASAPAYFGLSVTGAVRLHPQDSLDAALGAAFNEHQRRVAGTRRLLGPDAVAEVAGLFAASGWSVRRASTPWLLGAAHRELMRDWLDGWVDAATEQHPELAPAAEPYRRRRHDQATAGELRVEVGHEDLLAWPRFGAQSRSIGAAPAVDPAKRSAA